MGILKGDGMLYGFGVLSRDGISAGKKFRISDDLFRIHLGRASISAKFRLILHQFRIIQVNRLAGLSRSSIE